MSKYSRSGLRSKHELRRKLEKTAQQEIDDYLLTRLFIKYNEETDNFQTMEELYEKQYASDYWEFESDRMIDELTDQEDLYDSYDVDDDYDVGRS